MFTELYAVAKHTALQISVSPDGARLNVLIIPKPGDDAEKGSALTKPIQAIGTPEELDRELPAKLAEYCAAINDLRLKIDIPIEAITAEAGKGGRMKEKANPPPRTPARPSAPKPKKKAAPKPVKPAKKAAPVKPARPVKAPEEARRARRTQELATANSAKKSKRASREECLADLRAYLTECTNTNVAITRALFLSHNTTGRSYERKFKSWEEFLAEGRKAPGDETKPPSGETNPASGETNAGSDAPPANTTLSKTTLNPALKWPFPDSSRTAEAAKPVDRVVYLRRGSNAEKVLGTSAVSLAVGDTYTHLQYGALSVIEVITQGDLSERVIVAEPSPGAPADANPNTQPSTE